MGFLDTVRSMAGDLAADAERAGRYTAAQTKLVGLQQDLKKAERDLGRTAMDLIERGELSHPELTEIAERVRSTRTAIQDREAEIAGLRAPEPAGPAGCVACGSEVSEEARFCASCGAPVDREGPIDATWTEVPATEEQPPADEPPAPSPEEGPRH
jgi:hypothetical protein